MACTRETRRPQVGATNTDTRGLDPTTEVGPVDDRRISQDRLAALAAHLSAHKLVVELTDRGLVVRNPEVAGCCPEVPLATDTITCRPRSDDGGIWWFFTSWGTPIAPADRVTDATVTVKGYLSGVRR